MNLNICWQYINGGSMALEGSTTNTLISLFVGSVISWIGISISNRYAYRNEISTRVFDKKQTEYIAALDLLTNIQTNLQDLMRSSVAFREEVENHHDSTSEEAKRLDQEGVRVIESLSCIDREFSQISIHLRVYGSEAVNGACLQLYSDYKTQFQALAMNVIQTGVMRHEIYNSMMDCISQGITDLTSAIRNDLGVDEIHHQLGHIAGNCKRQKNEQMYK